MPLYHIDHINKAVDYLYSAIGNVMKEVVPFEKYNKPTNYPVWFSAETVSYNKLKNKYHKIYKKMNNQLC